MTITKGKLEAFRKHYEHLGRVSVDSDFDFEWKEVVERKVSMCSSLSRVCEDEALDRGIEKEEIAKCIQRLKNNKTSGSDGLVGELLKYGGSVIGAFIWSSVAGGGCALGMERGAYC